MSNTVGAVLLDTRSIQKYIFSSNKLTTNVGASYIVSHRVKQVMDRVLEAANLVQPKELWSSYGDIKLKTNASIECEYAYVGGGNMLLLLNKAGQDNVELGKQIVKEWSKQLLLVAPGLRTGAAIGELDLGNGFQTSYNNLVKQLKEHQNTVFPNVDLPYTGLTVECALSGKNADLCTSYFDGDKMSRKYVSAEALAKVNVFQEADKALKNSFADIVGDYNFTNKIDQLGQKAGDNYISVVHVDGNDMGVKFNNCSTLEQRKKLSISVAQATKEAFGELLETILKEYQSYSDNSFAKGGLFKLEEKVLPIRPIILGGDDITFVCPAKAGVIYTKRFIELLQKKMLKIYAKKGDANTIEVPLYSCGGIVIVPTSYPFFRAYELAEAVCGEAKKQARKAKKEGRKPKGSSWLDFLIVHGEQAADLEQIRAEEYNGYLGKMHYGPYLVAGASENKALDRLIMGALELAAMPRNKLKKMRDVIGKDTGEIKLFLEQLKHTDTYKFLPVVDNKLDRFRENLWYNAETPYLDMIEIQEFIYDEGRAAK